MSERRFVITEDVGRDRSFRSWSAVCSASSITESELKKRLDHAWGAASKFAPSETWDWDKAIDILLNGEGKEEESQFAPKDVSPYTRVFGIDDKPIRKDWEEWVEQMPENVYNPDEWERMMRYMKQWFLTMPGVPKK